jgi:uncharacterized repeat protein (TIGR02543 family)
MRYTLLDFHERLNFLIERRRYTVTRFKHHGTTKLTALFLALGLLWGGQLIFSRETGLDGLFKWAIKNYLDGKYREAAKDLELLLSYCDEDNNELKGKIYLLLGAVNEQLGNIPEAKKNYQLAGELLPDPAIEKVDLTSLKEYRRIVMNKQKPLESGIIEKPTAKPKKRKSSSLSYLVLGGIVIAGVAALLLLKKDKPAAVAKYYLSLHINGSGSVHRSPGGNPYAEGQIVTLTAGLNNGWQFDGWGGDLTGMENPTTIIMNSDKDVTANFSEITPGYYSLAVSIMGQGNVSLDPAGGTYLPGTMVRLRAIPALGWEFYRWYVDLDVSENPTNIIMDSHKNVTAMFIETNGINKIVGYPEVFSSIATNRNRLAMPVTMPENGTINSITMYHLGGTGRMILAVYDGESLPQNRLSVTPETNVGSSDGWQTITLSSPVSVRAGQIIWLAWVYENNPGIAYKSGTPGRAYSSAGWGAGMPEQFGLSYPSNLINSIYATYTPD